MPRLSIVRPLAVGALAALLAATAVRAQQITISGDDHSRAASIARDILARNDYVRISRDTVLPAAFHATGDLVVVGPAEVKLEGQVDGSVAVLGGQLYLRPDSRVGGPIGVLGGGVYPSARARYDEISEANTATTVQVRPDTASAREDADEHAARDSAEDASLTPATGDGDTTALAVRVKGPSRGLRFSPLFTPFPTYDRVNGASVSAGATVLLRGQELGPRLDAWGTVRRFNRPGGTARLTVPVVDRDVAAVAEASRGTRTNDAWSIGDLANSAAAVLAGSDYRDYYDADRLSLTLGRRYVRPIIPGESWFGPRAAVLVEKATSLAQREHWSLVHGRGLRRPNPGVDDGTVVSALVGFGYRKRWLTSRFDGDAQAERGLASAGDFGFTQLSVDGTYQARAIRMHQLSVRFHGMLPVGGDGAPQQRWAILGGATTLPTLPVAARRGDHLVYVASSYAIPFQRVYLPYIGQPSFELWHAAGTAWATGDRMPAWTQNVGAGIAFPLVHARVVIDPAADRIRPKGVFWVSLPGT
jgi:hypothetical protein